MRGRLPFDGKSKDEIIHQVIYDEPDYTNKSFLRLSKNVPDLSEVKCSVNL